jgi:hypothetical protein
MTYVKLPGFTAEMSFGSSHRPHSMKRVNEVLTDQILLQEWVPPGLCSKASRFCQTGREEQWCDILNNCLDDILL